jgi:hypothetical protein
MLLAMSVDALVAVTVNRTPVRLESPALLEHRRVLVPARAIFEALGAVVLYDSAARRVFVRRGERDVVISIGSANALAGGRPVSLDAPAILREGRAYVPLRFVAESLGARVDYEGTSRSVAIVDPTVLAARAPAKAAAHAPPTVEHRRPESGETVGGAFPSLSAAIETHGGPPVDPTTVRMFLDGRDVTDRTYRSGDLIGYTPAQQVLAGSHEVTVQGADESGQRFTSNWTFYSTFAYSTVPAAYNYSGFYVAGPTTYVLPGTIQLVLIAPPGGYGFANLCGYAQQFPFVYAAATSRYLATIAVPTNLFAPSCYVSGVFYEPGGMRNYLALGTPISINTMPVSLSTQRAQPTPSPAVLHVTHPTPVPRPTTRATPTPRPTTRATPTPRPTRRPSPRPS